MSRNDLNDSMPHALDAPAPMWPEGPGGVFRFSEYELDLRTWELRRGHEVVPLASLAFNVLAYLLRHRERAVTRHELMAALWPKAQVQDGSLGQAIWQIRRALNDSPREQRMVRTIRGRGYRFVAAASE